MMLLVEAFACAARRARKEEESPLAAYCTRKLGTGPIFLMPTIATIVFSRWDQRHRRRGTMGP